MFYCDYCRVQQELPQSIGWPYMGVSHGSCEYCHSIQMCHDVPSSSLKGRRARKLVLIACGECTEQHYAKHGDYLCTFCRGIDERPMPDQDLIEADQEVNLILKDIRDGKLDSIALSEYFRERYKRLLDNLP